MKLFELKLKNIDPSTIFSDLEEDVFYTLVCDHPDVVFDSIEVHQVNLSKLIPTQGIVDNLSVENSNPIIVAKRNNKFYIIDGHHRYARDRRRKIEEISACIIDLPSEHVNLEWFEALFKKKLKQRSTGSITFR